MAEVRYAPRTRVVFPNSVPEIRGPVWKVVVGPTGNAYLIKRSGGRRGPFIPEAMLVREDPEGQGLFVTTMFDPGDAIRDKNHYGFAGIIEYAIVSEKGTAYHIEGERELILERYAVAVTRLEAHVLRFRSRPSTCRARLNANI